MLLVAGLVLASLCIVGLEVWLRASEGANGLRPFPAPGLGYLIERQPAELGVAGDIVVLGDSVSDGGGLPRAVAWPARASELLGRDVYNLSSIGWDISHIAAAAETIAPERELLVYAAFTNDTTPTHVLGHPPMYLSATPAEGLEWTAGWLEHAALLRWYVGARYARAGPADTDPAFFEEHFERLAESAGDELLVFVLVPHVFAANEPAGTEHYEKHWWSSQASEHQQILDAAERAGVPAASVFPYLVASGERDFMREDLDDRVHPSAAGQALFAEAFVDVLGRHERGEPFLDAEFVVDTERRRGHRPGGGKRNR